MAVVELAGEVVPLLDLAESEVGRDIAHRKVIEDLIDVLRLNTVQDHEAGGREAGTSQAVPERRNRSIRFG